MFRLTWKFDNDHEWYRDFNTKAPYNSGSNFDRQGQWLIGKYLGAYWVTGTVVESRVKYGGKVQHTIVSDSPTMVNGEERSIGTRFTVEESEIFYCEVGTEQFSGV